MMAWLRPRSEGAQKVALDVARAARAAYHGMPLYIIADYIGALGQHHEDRWQATHKEFSAASPALRSYDRPSTLAALAPVSPRRWPELLAGVEDLRSDSDRAQFALRAKARTPEDKALLQKLLSLTHGLGVRASRDALLAFTPPQRDNLLQIPVSRRFEATIPRECKRRETTAGHFGGGATPFGPAADSPIGSQQLVHRRHTSTPHGGSTLITLVRCGGPLARGR